MRNLEISHDDFHAILNALAVAAERYEENAREIGDAVGEEPREPFPAIIDTFKRQAADCRRIAVELIEGS